MLTYQVTNAIPEVYLDQFGKAVNGYKVSFVIPSLNEPHTVYVPRLDAVEIRRAIEVLITEREKLTTMGK
jgi:hypothetical protein